MIRVEIYLQDGFFRGLKSEGHASIDSGTKGSNPICAGVSTLVQTLFLYLKKQRLIEKFSQRDGFFHFELVAIRNPKLTVVVDNAYKLIVLGLEEILRQFPEEVVLEYINQSLQEAQIVS